MATDNEPEETSGLGCAFDSFQEYEEVKSIIDNLPNTYTDEKASEKAFERFYYIISLYQEQPHLIDPYLERILSHVLGYVRKTSSPKPLQHKAFQLMHLVTKTRGPKILVRHMPHEVGDLQLILKLISEQDMKDLDTWQSRYMLLIWLSIVVLIPIDLNRLDGGLSDKTGASTPDRITGIIKTYIEAIDRSFSAAPLLAGRFLTRPDAILTQLPGFIDWSLNVFSVHHDFLDVKFVNKVSMTLSSLAQLFKLGKRDDMIIYAPKVLRNLHEIKFNEHKEFVIRKLTVKVIQRIGLTFLKVKVAPWRYQRGRRTLVTNLSTVSDIANRPSELISDEDTEEYDIPEEIEDIIEVLLKGLQDESSVIRWSAAKGIGRITERLPKELADDVIASLIEIFSVKEGDEGWHGGCLALAEMGRRGLLLPIHLDTIIPLIMKGLIYDKLKGNCSVGSAVRDAACYVCWAFARAYSHDVLKPYVQKLAEGLLITAVFDREVNCRRAAAAAFQENVGRQGTFPHGIEILTTVDFFSVSLRSHSYLHLSIFVSQYEEYTIPLIDHLIEFKINHWDIDVRKLASQALHNLTPKASRYMVTNVLPKLIPLTTSYDMNSRHGSILSISEIIEALSKLKVDENFTKFVGNTNFEGIRNIAFVLQEKKAFRGLGEEMLRKAMCVFIHKLSLAKLFPQDSLDYPLLDLWKEILYECLTKCDVALQNEAAIAFSEMCKSYFVNEPTAYQNIVKHCLENLASAKQETRCGFAKVLGGLPKVIILPNFNNIMVELMQQMNRNDKLEETWVESRRDAIEAITNITRNVGMDTIPNTMVSELFTCFLRATDDYTTDRRGDIGSLVRMAALNGLESFTLLVTGFNPSLLDQAIVTQIFCTCIREALGKIDKVQEVANLTLLKLLRSKPEVPFIPHRERLLELFDPKCCEGVIWKNYSETFPFYIKLLCEDTYTNDVLLGFSIAIGSHIVYLMKYTQTCVLSYLTSIKHSKDKLTKIENALLHLLRENLKNKRTIVPLLSMADFLINSGIFDQTDPDKFPLELLKLSWKAGGRSKETERVLAVIDVLSNLINFEGKCRTTALKYLSSLLCHYYPRVRNAAAQKMYESIVGGVDIVPDENLDEVLEILSETEWTKSIDKNEFKPLRVKVCELIGVSQKNNSVNN